VLLAYAAWLRGQTRQLIVWLAVATVIFRGELVLLAGPILALEWLYGRIDFARGVTTGVIAGVASLGAAANRCCRLTPQIAPGSSMVEATDGAGRSGAGGGSAHGPGGLVLLAAVAVARGRRAVL